MRFKLWLAITLMLVACAGDDGTEPDAGLADNEDEELLATDLLTLSSPAFEDGAPIPEQYTCDGGDAPPPLTWREPPAGVASYALLMDDPDAPGDAWVHWVLYNIPPDIQAIGEGDIGVTGSNSWNRAEYGGPCPPTGEEHRYFFKLFALGSRLDLEPGSEAEELLQAMEGHILAQAQLMGTYRR